MVSFQNGDLHTFFSKGDGSYFVIDDDTPPNTFNNSAVWVADYTGDGKGDVLTFSNGWLYTHAAHINSSTDKSPDLLSNIVNPFGGNNSIIYQPLTDNAVYAKDTGAQAAVYPNVDLQYPLYVVSKTS